MRRAILFALFLPAAANAQYAGPAVETCHAYAKRELARDASPAKDVVIERDPNLVIERYTRKVGNQFVSSILSGNGAVVFANNAPSAELAFICLLADEKRAVFFAWLPRRDASAMAQCTRDQATRAQPRPCLETLLQVSESDLSQAYAGKRSDADRESNRAWLQYRDAECNRRKNLALADVDPEDYRVACLVELTRRRLADMR